MRSADQFQAVDFVELRGDPYDEEKKVSVPSLVLGDLCTVVKQSRTVEH
jgi:hypothetical protein